MDTAARYLFVKPPSPTSLHDRLSSSGHDEAAIQAILAKLPDETDETKVAESFDKTIVNEDLEQAAEALSAYIFEKEGEQEEEEEEELPQPTEADVAPADAQVDDEAEGEQSRNGDASMTDAPTDKAADESNDDARSDCTEDRCIEVKM